MRLKQWIATLLLLVCGLGSWAPAASAEDIAICTYMSSGRDLYGKKYDTYWCEMYFDDLTFAGGWFIRIPVR
ncbi:MAG TPA: hypothetical protein VFQ39_13585 [Longimicrobium sp.]|nr:hypothetical protein [Longimicrobium sp.]